MLEVNDVITRVVNDKSYSKFLLRNTLMNPDFFEDNIEGEITSDNLCLLIERVKLNKVAVELLPDFIKYVNEESITSEIFEKMLRLSKRLRRNCMIELAHKRLAFYQLYAINKMHIATEAFCQLLFLMCQYDCFSVIDVKQLLLDSTVPPVIIQSSIETIHKTIGMSEKLKECQAYLSGK